MPRKEARIFTSIWQDTDFVALSPDAQRMYFLLLSQPELTLCGHLTLAVNRWSGMASGMTLARVQADMKLLTDAQPRPFILVDYGTDEVLIRSFVRRDRVLRSPKLVRPLVAAVMLVRSPLLQRALRDELQASLDEELPTSARDAVEQLIKHLSPQVNRVSDTLSDTVSDRVPDRVQEKGEGVSVTPAVDYLERPEVDRLCQLLAELIVANGSKRPAVGKAWRDACRLMIDRDGRTPEQIEKAIRWCQQDEFWRANIMSMPKLRDKYDQLRLAAAKRGNGTGQFASTPRVRPHDEHKLRR